MDKIFENFFASGKWIRPELVKWESSGIFVYYPLNGRM